MKFKELILEGEMRFQALAAAKEIHSQLADITFIEMLSMMSSSNPAKKEVQELESDINELTNKVGNFIQKYIPDVADAESDDVDELPEEPEEEKPIKKEKGK